MIPFIDTTWDNFSIKITYLNQQIPSPAGLTQFGNTDTVSGIMELETLQRYLCPNATGVKVNNYFKHLAAEY